jgi:hypothetical protein
MSKLIKVERVGSAYFTMEVQFEDGRKELWSYERTATATGTSFSMVNREDR